MTVRPHDDLATLLAPARAALGDEALVERFVHLARSRTFRQARSGSRARPSASAWRRPRAFVLAFAVLAIVLASSALLRRTGAWGGNDVTSSSIAYSVGAVPGLLGERIAAESPRTLEFTDGTRVDLASGGAMRVISLDDRGGRLLLEQGTVRASFRHRERTYWTVEAGGVVVEVTGTRFDVRWDQAAQTFELDMHEGSVRLHGCGLEHGRVAKDGDVVQASCATSKPATVQAPVLTLTPSDLPSVAVAPVPPAGSAASGASATDLLARADDERRAKNSAAARATLLEIRRRFAHGKEAAQAAFDLGVVAFDIDARFAESATWFRRYLDEAPRGPLAREASGRLLEALERGGDSAAATKSAARYLETYPGGPHASLAKRLVAPSP
jgi:hypothetical protein